MRADRPSALPKKIKKEARPRKGAGPPLFAGESPGLSRTQGRFFARRDGFGWEKRAAFRYHLDEPAHPLTSVLPNTLVPDR